MDLRVFAWRPEEIIKILQERSGVWSFKIWGANAPLEVPPANRKLALEVIGPDADGEFSLTYRRGNQVVIKKAKGVEAVAKAYASFCKTEWNAYLDQASPH